MTRQTLQQLGTGCHEENARLIAAIKCANHQAHTECDRVTRRQLLDQKDALLSSVLERRIGHTLASWQRQPNGEWLVLISIDGRAAFHAPFERLSVFAQLEVVREAGPAPDAYQAFRAKVA